jgi:hypothetical protein
MENILVGCRRVEINLSSVPESCFTHVGARTDLVEISWKSTGTIRSEEIYKSQSYGRSGQRGAGGYIINGRGVLVQLSIANSPGPLPTSVPRRQEQTQHGSAFLMYKELDKLGDN